MYIYTHTGPCWQGYGETGTSWMASNVDNSYSPTAKTIWR